MVEEFLRNHQHLKPVTLYNLYDRFLKCSNGAMLLLFNIFKDQYELHSINSFRLNGESLNAVLEEDKLTGWIIEDYLANNNLKFSKEVAGDREITNKYIESDENRGLELLTTRALKTVETMVGREI